MTERDGYLAENWPTDADGDALRRLASEGIEIDKPYWVDFNVDFEKWPPPNEAIELLISKFPGAFLEREADSDDGYILLKLFGTLSYKWVVQTQKELSNLMEPFHGSCQSWGVLL